MASNAKRHASTGSRRPTVVAIERRRSRAFIERIGRCRGCRGSSDAEVGRRVGVAGVDVGLYGVDGVVPRAARRRRRGRSTAARPRRPRGSRALGPAFGGRLGAQSASCASSSSSFESLFPKDGVHLMRSHAQEGAMPNEDANHPCHEVRPPSGPALRPGRRGTDSGPVREIGEAVARYALSGVRSFRIVASVIAIAALQAALTTALVLSCRFDVKPGE